LLRSVLSDAPHSRARSVNLRWDVRRTDGFQNFELRHGVREGMLQNSLTLLKHELGSATMDSL
jgi:hypothetical protein